MGSILIVSEVIDLFYIILEHSNIDILYTTIFFKTV